MDSFGLMEFIELSFGQFTDDYPGYYWSFDESASGNNAAIDSVHNEVAILFVADFQFLYSLFLRF